MSKTTIGWIGLGNMGVPMCNNLLKAGYPVTVFNRTAGKEKLLTAHPNLKTASSAGQLLQASEVVFVMVSDDAAVEQLFEAPDGLFSVDIKAQNKLIINTSTVAPATSRSMAQKCLAKGIDYLEAPVSGSVKPAEDASLVILAGGPTEVLERARPLLNCLGKKIMHLGDWGSAGIAKLAINLLVGFNIQGLAEAVLFAGQHGISKADMLEIVNEGACGNGITKGKTPLLLSGNYAPAFSVKNYAKDLRLARQSGVATPMALALHDAYQAALAQYEAEDAMAIFKQLKNNQQPPAADARGNAHSAANSR